MEQPRESLPKAESARSTGELGSAGWSGADGGVDRGMRVLSYLLSGVIVYGLLGWLGDHLLGTVFLLPVGIVAGAAMGVYVIIRRYGKPVEMPPAPRRRLRPSQEYALRRYSR